MDVSNRHNLKGFILKQLLLKAVNMFENMQISENIYEGLVQPYYKKITTI